MFLPFDHPLTVWPPLWKLHSKLILTKKNQTGKSNGWDTTRGSNVISPIRIVLWSLWYKGDTYYHGSANVVVWPILNWNFHYLLHPFYYWNRTCELMSSSCLMAISSCVRWAVRYLLTRCHYLLSNLTSAHLHRVIFIFIYLLTSFILFFHRVILHVFTFFTLPMKLHSSSIPSELFLSVVRCSTQASIGVDVSELFMHV